MVGKLLRNYLILVYDRIMENTELMTNTLKQMSEWLDCDVIHGEDMLNIEIEHCFCADLMSDVLAYANENSVLLTGLKSIQSVRTANVADIKAIIFLRGKNLTKLLLSVQLKKKFLYFQPGSQL